MFGILLALTLSAGFENPPDAAKSRVWWHWMNGNVSKAGITADLESMASAGIGGAHIFDVGCNVPPGPVKFNTPAWDEHIRFAAAEAKRLGLELTLVNCSGYANAGGPWVAASNSMFFVTCSESEVKGGSRLDTPLPRCASDNGFYRDIAVLAFPKPACETQVPTDLSMTGPKDGTCTFASAEPFTLRGISFRLTLHAWAWDRRMDLTIETSDDGVTWREACRCSDLVVSGGTADCTKEPKTLFFPQPVTARQIRFKSDFSRGRKNERKPGASFAELKPVYRCGLPALNALTMRSRFDRIAPIPSALVDSEAIDPANIVNLTGLLRNDDKLDWAVPAGRDWIVLRVGYCSNGKKTVPASQFGGGYEVDKLDAAAVARHFDAYVGRLADEAAVKSVLCDSWEVGTQNWTHGFERVFEKKCGYSLVPYLAAFSGRLVGSAARTDEVLRDFRRCVSDTFVEAFSGTFARKCKERGLVWAAESYGNAPADNLSWSRPADIPMAEFWVSDKPGAVDTDDRLPHELIAKVAASDAHVYGKRFVDAEGFTAHPDRGGRWQMDPFGLKAFGDRMYCAGVNRMVYHRFAHQPWVEPARLPGMTMGPWGTHFERTETWWPMVGPFLRYQARCQYLLQEGRFAGDLLCYAGDEVPNTGNPETDIRGGYDWDSCNRELLPRLTVKGGRLVAPSGAEYAMLVLPTNRILTASSRREFERLRQAGARIVTTADELGLEPDFRCADAALHVRAIHRRYADGTDGYFVAYPGTNAVSVECSFRIAGRFPQVWDAETGVRYRARNWRPDGDRTRVTLDFKPAGSFFVMFAASEDKTLPLEPCERTTATVDVKGPWKLSFPEGWRCPQFVTLETLRSWTEIPDGEVKYFSGIATYETRVDAEGLGATGGRVWLDLGRVKNLAEVTVNGKTYAALWRPPFRVDVTDAVKANPKSLDVTIRVANLWPNRLIGDAQLPEDCEWKRGESLAAIPDWVSQGRPSPAGRLTFTTWNHWKKDEPLLESGLLGPVRLLVRADAANCVSIGNR